MSSNMFRHAFAFLLAAFALAAVSVADAQRPRQTPYWASIASGQAMMRTGPGRNFRGTRLYRRAALPIQVIQVYPNWRKIRDHDETVGWMMVLFLCDTRPSIVRGDEPRLLYADADALSPVLLRAEPGV